MGSNHFHRSFVMLKNKDKGFGHASGKEPSGYCKLEVRKSFGRIQVYIQDLKPAGTGKGTYDLVLVAKPSSIAPLRLSAIWPEEDGRFERRISFNPYNVEDSGYEIDSFQGIAIVYSPRGEGTNMDFPLVGYRDKYIDFDWRGDIAKRLATLYSSNAQTESEQPQKHHDQQAETPMQDSISEQTDSKLPQVSTSQQFGTKEQFDTELTYEETELEDDSVQSEDELFPIDTEYNIDYPNEFDKEPLTTEGESDESYYGEDINESVGADYSDNNLENDIFDSDPKDPDDVNFHSDTIEANDTIFDTDAIFDGDAIDNNYDLDDLDIYGDYDKQEDDTYQEPYKPSKEDVTYWDKVKKYYDGLFQRHRRLCPFDTASEEDWVRIEHRDDPASTHFKRPVDMYGLDANFIDHYLVGLRRKEGSVQYVIYAIPGIYSSVPPMSIHGLSKWLPVRGGRGTGYWLLYIDAKTGEIAYPD